jgi:hypothetical protein
MQNVTQCKDAGWGEYSLKALLRTEVKIESWCYIIINKNILLYLK